MLFWNNGHLFRLLYFVYTQCKIKISCIIKIGFSQIPSVFVETVFCALFPVNACKVRRVGESECHHQSMTKRKSVSVSWSQLWSSTVALRHHDCQLFIVLLSRESADAWNTATETADGLLCRMLCGSQTGIYGTLLFMMDSLHWLLLNSCHVMIYCEVCDDEYYCYHIL